MFHLVSETHPEQDVVIGKRCRSVRFHPEVEVYNSEIKLTEEEIKFAWLQPNEKRQIKRGIRETIDLMKKGCIINENTHCVRGLENLVDKTETVKSRRRVTMAVLMEQELQRSEGVCLDEELIAMVSRERSITHAAHGVLRGSE
jgi:hypothetical protein